MKNGKRNRAIAAAFKNVEREEPKTSQRKSDGRRIQRMHLLFFFPEQLHSDIKKLTIEELERLIAWIEHTRYM